MESNNYRIYRYTFPDGKVYIGVTKNRIETRRDQGYQHNKALQKAIRSVGWSGMKAEIIEDGLSKSEAYKKEKYYIQKHCSNDPDKGYNISLGGKATFENLHHTEEHKKYMSNLYKGKVFSEEHIANLKKAHAKERIAVVRIREDGTTEVYESLTEAAESVGGHKTNISRACKSGKPYRDSRWAFEKGGDGR